MKFKKAKPVTKHLRKLHMKHHLSHRTMFYMKEYGPGKDVHVVIVKESLKIIQESKNNLEKIENSGETLIEKAFEGLNDLKEGAQNLLSDSKSKTGEAQTCP